MASTLLKPKFVVLDSSHLADLARDHASSDERLRRLAREFQSAFDATGSVLLLSWHHMAELLAHQNPRLVSEVVGFLESLPLVACVSSAKSTDVIGSILDLQALEVSAAFANQDADVIAIRDFVARKMLRLTSGPAALRPFLEALPILQTEFVRQQARDREIVAISRSDFAGVAQIKIADMLRGHARLPEDIRHRLQVMHDKLSHDMKARGDNRIPDADATAASFLASVRKLGGAIVGSDNPGLRILEAFGIELSDIDSNTTVADVGALASFHSKLRVINRITQLPWLELKTAISERRLPSQVVQAGIGQFRPDGKQWKGSDLNDAHLGSLAAYTDVTYVDKRTYEAFRAARSKLPILAQLVRRVEKAGRYSDIIEQLRHSNASGRPKVEALSQDRRS